ncbi:MAG: transcription antitermination factor NusB [Legionellales bacterium]|jgi:N utilization substance protein B
MKKNNLGKHKARRFAVQAIYQWQMSGTPILQIQQQFLAQKNNATFDTDYFAEILHGVVDNYAQLDELLTPYMSRSIDAVDPIERAVLRIATYEFVYCLQIPYKVVINEALDLTKMFGTIEGHKFVNGVLDKLARQTRQLEMQG